MRAAWDLGGPPALLDATPWTPPERWAGLVEEWGEPVWQVEVVVRDAAGRPAADDVLVHALVENGDLAGLENGDLADTTAYRSSARRTHEGRLLVCGRGREAVLRLTASGLAEVVVALAGVPAAVN